MASPVSNNDVPPPTWNTDSPTVSGSASVANGGESAAEIELDEELDPNSSLNVQQNDLRRSLRALSHSHGGVEPPPLNLDVSPNVQPDQKPK